MDSLLKEMQYFEPLLVTITCTPVFNAATEN